MKLTTKWEMIGWLNRIAGVFSVPTMPNRTPVLELDPLSARELDELGRYLLRESNSGQCMNLSMLDGYLTAVVCCPEAISPTRWLKWVWDSECGEEAPEFASPAQGACLLSLIVRHWNDIARTLERAPQHYVPLLLQERKTKKPVIEAWCAGFMTGIRISKRAWQGMITAHPDDFSTMQLFGTDEGFEARGCQSATLDEYRKRAYSIADSVRLVYSLRRQRNAPAGARKTANARNRSKYRAPVQPQAIDTPDETSERPDEQPGTSPTLH